MVQGQSPHQIVVQQPREVAQSTMDRVVGEVAYKSDNVYFTATNLGLAQREKIVAKKLEIKSKMHASRIRLVEGCCPIQNPKIAPAPQRNFIQGYKLFL